MIVVFRRIKEAAGRVTGTEWLLVAVEGLLVFLGIVAAFELEQWAEDRRDAKARGELVQRLLVEAEETVTILRDNRDFMETRIDGAAQQLEAWVREGRCPPIDLAIARYYRPLDAPTAVYDEMIGSGGLSLLPGERERRAVSHYAAMLRAFERQQEHYSQSINYDLEPIVNTGITPRYNPDIGWYDLPQTNETGCNDPVAQTQAIFEARMMQVQQEQRALLTDNAIAMCAVLADSAGRTCTPEEGPLEGDDLATANEAVEANE